MGKDFHSVTVFLRVCCTMIHGFHAVGRYMHCVCTHSFVVCVLLHCRIQVLFRCSSMFDQCNILNFQAFPTLCLHFSAALPGSSLMLPLRLPFLVRSCHRHPPQIEHFPSSPAKLHLVRLHADSPLLWSPFSSSSQRETGLAGQARLLCLFHNWLLTMFHLRDGQSSLFASACPLMPLWLSEEAFTTN